MGQVSNNSTESPRGRIEAIRSFHNELLAKGGGMAAAHHYLCGWSSSESQRARFVALLRSVDYKGGSVVDFGCGTGDLFNYLSRQRYAFSYIGLDMNGAMLSIARSSYQARFQLIEPDIVDFPRVDYVFASGVFQFLDLNEPFYYHKLVNVLFKKCNVVFAANFLSTLRENSEKRREELYLHPQELIGLASSLSGRWLLDHSYHPGRGDMTVGIRASPQKEPWRRP